MTTYFNVALLRQFLATLAGKSLPKFSFFGFLPFHKIVLSQFLFLQKYYIGGEILSGELSISKF